MVKILTDIRPIFSKTLSWNFLKLWQSWKSTSRLWETLGCFKSLTLDVEKIADMQIHNVINSSLWYRRCQSNLKVIHWQSPVTVWSISHSKLGWCAPEKSMWSDDIIYATYLLFLVIYLSLVRSRRMHEISCAGSLFFQWGPKNETWSQVNYLEIEYIDDLRPKPVTTQAI